MATPSITNVEAAAGGAVRGRHHPARSARRLGLVRSPTGLHSAHARSVHGPGRPVEGIQGLAAQSGARPRGINLLQPCFQTLDRTLAVCGAQGETALRTSISPDRGSEPPGASPNLARESRRLAGVNRQQRAISLTRFPGRPKLRAKGPGTFETGNRRSGAAGDREVARRTPITPDREG